VKQFLLMQVALESIPGTNQYLAMRIKFLAQGVFDRAQTED